MLSARVWGRGVPTPSAIALVRVRVHEAGEDQRGHAGLRGLAMPAFVMMLSSYIKLGVLLFVMHMFIYVTVGIYIYIYIYCYFFSVMFSL